MLDQLSGGRLDLGVGRGISPFEHRLFGHDPDESRARFHELLPMVVQGLATGRMDSTGSEHYDFPEIELAVEPVQRPYPPLWAAGNVEAAARNGLNVVSGMPVTPEMRRRYDELWAESRHAPDPLNPHVAEPVVASSQYVCIADTDEEARRIGERALGVLAAFLARSIGREPPHLQDPDRPEPPTPLVQAIRTRAPGRARMRVAGDGAQPLRPLRGGGHGERDRDQRAVRRHDVRGGRAHARRVRLRRHAGRARGGRLTGRTLGREWPISTRNGRRRSLP